MVNKEILIDETEKVKHYLYETDQIYENARATREEKDFYSAIKPFVDDVHKQLDQWIVLAQNFINEHRPKNLYNQQIIAAAENLKEICVQAFFPKTSYARFKHNVHSINYTLEKLLDEIKQIE